MNWWKMYDEWNRYDTIKVGRLYKIGERIRKGIYPDYVYVIEVSKSRFGQIPNMRVITFEDNTKLYSIHGADFIEYYEVVEDE